MSKLNLELQSIEKKKAPSRLKKVAVKAGAIIAGAAVVSGVTVFAIDALRDKRSPAEIAEASRIEKIRAGEMKGKGEPNTLVFNTGVKFRSTPDMAVNTHNVVGKVPKGQVLVIDHALSYEDHRGDAWVGFTMEEDLPKEGETRSAEEIANKMYWINLTQIAEQTDKNGNVLVEKYANFGESSSVAPRLDVSASGNVTVVGANNNSNQAAVGKLGPQDFAQFIEQATNLPHTP